ncbi:hypothetical protein G9U52_19275 [Paenibacillus sp. S3N08]|uniref:Uncharacterized protein n=1 Tax=Paenibacillus agricola TaxID=2716264 RepID=A0ABX0J9K2_9BACL|nr:hypothetical protein [Paenibacillus agricola]
MRLRVLGALPSLRTRLAVDVVPVEGLRVLGTLPSLRDTLDCGALALSADCGALGGRIVPAGLAGLVFGAWLRPRAGQASASCKWRLA